MTEKKNPKPDNGRNADGIEAAIASQREKEASLHMVRVSRDTWIAVPKKKANAKYAAKYKAEHVDVKTTRL